MLVEFWAFQHASTALRCPLPDVETWAITPVANDAGAIELTYPPDGVNFAVLRENVTLDRDLTLQVRIDGVVYPELQATLMDHDGDDVAEGSVWTFVGDLALGRLAEAVVEPQGGMPTQGEDSELEQDAHYYSCTAGTIMGTMLAEAQARGTLTDVTRSFTNTHDTAGAPWSQIITLKFTPGTVDYLQVVQALVDAGLCEVRMHGKDLRLYEPGGTGVDRTLTTPPLVFRRGQNILDSPRKHTVRKTATAALVAGAGGLYEWATDAAALARRGRRIEVGATQGQIRDPGTLTAYAEHFLAGRVSGRMQKTHGLTLADGPLPFVHFNIQDWGWSDLGAVAHEKLRVAQIVLAGAADGTVTGSVTLNDLIAERDAALVRRLRGIEGGSTILGTSQARPLGPEDLPDTMPPAAPAGVAVESLAETTPDPVPRAAVIVEWTPVTTNADSTPLEDLAGYVVQFRYLSPALVNNWHQPVPMVATETADWSGVIAGEGIEIRVAAVDVTGNQGEWSSPSAFHTTETDETPPPTPSTPLVDNYLGVLRIAFDGKGSAGEPQPVNYKNTEFHASTVSGFTPDPDGITDGGTRIAEFRGAHVYAWSPPGSLGEPEYDTEWFIRLVSVDQAGNRSAPSAQASAIPGKVEEGDVASVNVGVLVSGILSAIVANLGVIYGGDPAGFHYEISADGIQFFDGDDNVSIDLDAATASASLTGTVQTGRTGQRIVMSGTDGDIKLYPQSGETRYARFWSYVPSNYPDDIAIELRAIDSDESAYATRHWLLPDAQSLQVAPQGEGGYLVSKSSLRISPDGISMRYNNVLGTAPFVDGDDTLRSGLFIDNNAVKVEFKNGVNDTARGYQSVEDNGVFVEVRNGADRDGGFLWLNRGGVGDVYFGRKTATADHFILITGSVIRAAINNSVQLEVGTDRIRASRFSGWGTDAGQLQCAGNIGTVSFRDDGSANMILDSPKAPVYVKNFVIDHPADPDRWLVHGCTESPVAGVEYSGTVTVEDYQAQVELPTYFEDLTRTDGRQVFLQVMLPDEGFHPYIPRAIPSYPVNGQFRISTDALDGVRICWLVKAIRNDVDPLEVEPLKTGGTVAGAGPYTYYVPSTP